MGTGVGSGIVANGQLIYGCDGFAGELGHMVVEPEGRPCGCGRKGCLETYCSATGVVRTTVAMLEESTEPTSLRDIPREELSSYEVYKAAMAGDAMAKEVSAKRVEELVLHVQTLQPSLVLRLSSSSEDWHRQATYSSILWRKHIMRMCFHYIKVRQNS